MESTKEAYQTGVVEVRWPHFFTILFYLHAILFVILWSVASLTFWQVIAITLVSYLLSRIIGTKVRWHVNERIPGPSTRFLLGAIHHLDPKTILLQMVEWTKQHGPVGYIKGPIGFPGAAFTGSPEAAQHILRTDTPKSFYYTYFYPWLGIGLLTANGSVWKRKRRLLTPAFHFAILKRYVPVYSMCTERFITKCEKHANMQEAFDIYPYITALTLDIIALCAFGIDLKTQTTNDYAEYVQAVHEASDLTFKRIINPFYTWNWVYFLSPQGRKFRRVTRVIHDLPLRVIRERRAEYQRNRQLGMSIAESKHKDFLDLLLTTVDAETGKGLDDWEILNEVDTFMFEGHDTTAAGLAWAIYNLAKYPEELKKVQAEIDRVLGDVNELTIETLNKMEYLTMCIKETLRLYPPVPSFARTLHEDKVICGYRIKSQTEVFVNPYAIHRNPQYWDEPVEKFDPTRFEPSRSQARHPYAFIPFSAGNRNCIGQQFALNEERAVLSLFLRRFCPKLVEGFIYQPTPYLILRPEYGIQIVLQHRTQS